LSAHLEGRIWRGQKRSTVRKTVSPVHQLQQSSNAPTIPKEKILHTEIRNQSDTTFVFRKQTSSWKVKHDDESYLRLNFSQDAPHPDSDNRYRFCVFAKNRYRYVP
jgi:hypothetical protein